MGERDREQVHDFQKCLEQFVRIRKQAAAKSKNRARQTDHRMEGEAVSDDTFADLLPPLSHEEFSALEADIKEHGVRDPVYVDEHGAVLDGRNRLKICPDAKRKVIRGLSDGEKEAFVFRANFVRRNLSPDQKEEVRKRMRLTAAKLREEDAAKYTQQRVAEVLGVDRTTVSKWFDTSNVNGHNASKPDARIVVSREKKAEIVAKVKGGETQSQAAADCGISQQRVSQIVKQAAAKSKNRARQKEVGIPTGQYDLLLLDPPWQYDFSGTSNREIENKYGSMTVEEICEVQLPAAKDCVLLLWATAPKLREALRVMEAWGFEYKTHAIWDKVSIGMGYWFRGRHELLLIGTKGSVSPPDQKNRQASVFTEKRGSKHSKKPECVFKWIEKAFPKLSKCELFGREPRKGWSSWGNEIESK